MERAAPLFYISPAQINYVVPPGTATGLATITVATQGQTSAAGTLRIDPVAPGLFAANANGAGVAAAVAERVQQGGAVTWHNVFACGPAPGSCAPAPLDLGPATDLLYLHLYGTGIRGRSEPLRGHRKDRRRGRDRLLRRSGGHHPRPG